jgi:hypothetical protein
MIMLKHRHTFVVLVGLAVVLTAAGVGARELEPDVDAAPYLITVGDPNDPLYANAGDNLRNGVGSLYIEFAGTAPLGYGFICTASVIGPRQILTAAHCVREPDDTVSGIWFVLSAGLDSPVVIPGVSFAVHPWYDIFAPFYGAFAHGDIAVIELMEDVPEGIDVYELYRDDDEFGQETRHYGHGRSGKGNKGATGGSDFFYARTGLNTYEQYLEPFFGDGLEDQLLHDFDSGGRKHNAMEWWFTSAFACHPDNPNNPPWAQDGQCTTFKDGSYPDFKGYGKLEVGVAPGDSGGPGFIDGKIAGVHSFGFTHFCQGITNGTDFTCGLDSSFGEMAGDTRVSYHADFVDFVMAGLFPNTPVPEPVETIVETASVESPLAQNERGRYFINNVFSRTLRQPVLP